MKYEKRALNIDEQLALLENRGLTIGDEVEARLILEHLGFYHFGVFLHPFREQGDTRRIQKGTSIGDVYGLFELDRQLRSLLRDFLEIVERDFRSILSNCTSMHYRESPYWYSDRAIMGGKPLMRKRYEKLVKHSEQLQRHHERYRTEAYAPAWKVLEAMTFGECLYLYGSLSRKGLKTQIANQYDIGKVDYFSNHLEGLLTTRNLCAHGQRIFDLHLRKGLAPLRRNGGKGRNGGHHLGAVVLTMHHYLRRANRDQDFKNSLLSLWEGMPRTKCADILEIESKISGEFILHDLVD